MEKLYSYIVRLPVVDEDGNSYGRVRDVIIDPETGLVLAFVLRARKLVVPYEVSRIGVRLIIRDEDAIVSLDDLPRVAKVWQQQIRIIGQRVIGEKSRTSIGKVTDFEVDTVHMKLAKIYATKLLLFFPLGERTFIAKDIIRITKKGIYVRDQEAVPVKTVKEEAVLGSQPAAA